MGVPEGPRGWRRVLRTTLPEPTDFVYDSVHVQLAVNRQPGYRQGTRRAALDGMDVINIKKCDPCGRSKDGPSRGVLRAQCSSRHADWTKRKLKQREDCMQSARMIGQRNPEHEQVKCGQTITFSRAAGAPRPSASVCATGGNPSTRLPPEELAEQL